MIIKERLTSIRHCCVCERSVPEGSLVLIHDETRLIICLICLVEIAEVPIDS